MKLDIEKEVAALQRMSAGQLGERYAELFGEQTRTRHRTYLIRKIAWKLQVLVEGDLSDRARRRAEQLARGAELRVMPPKTDATPALPSATVVTRTVSCNDPRLPTPGTALVRKYKGATYQVLVLGEGFELGGQRYKSLTAVAKAITGSHVNGYRFFGLEAK